MAIAQSSGWFLLAAGTLAGVPGGLPAQTPEPRITSPHADALLRDPAASPTRLLTAILAGKDPGREVPVAAVRAALRAGDALVEFVAWSADGTERLTALVLRPEGDPVRFDLGTSDAMRRATTTWLQLLAREQRPLDDASQRLLDDAARRVATLVLQPLASAIAGCQRVFFAPAGDLRLVPFDALPTHRGDTLLVETLDVRQVACGSELALPGHTAPAIAPILLVVDAGSIDRPEAGREARSIAAAWPGTERRPVQLRTLADLATTPGDPLQPAFVHLAGTNRLSGPPTRSRADARDASWPAVERAAVDLTSCRLVVTSATNEPAQPDGAPVLAAAWAWCDAVRAHGTAACLVPLWPIGAAQAREFTTAFWHELRVDDEPARALRHLKLRRIEANRAAHGRALPGTWAAFQLVGVGER